MKPVIIIGGGLSGCEAAWQVAKRGIPVTLFEMRPHVQTGAHTTSNLAELVCSNSLGSLHVDRASGLLKEELRLLDSLLLKCAEQSAVPAGSALAVDREAFSQSVSTNLAQNPLITLVREEVSEIPSTPTIIASGPLTSPALSRSLAELTGESHLFFFDAIAPILAKDSIDMTKAFKASRYDDGETEGDYINCPLTKEEYEKFVAALIAAEKITLKEFELEINSGVKAGYHQFFEGCLPVEIIASRGLESLAFGPMRPVGLIDPRTGRRPHAVLQLRRDNLADTLYNMVGFQTNLKFEEQERVFGMIPGLEQAQWVRHGQMHRNTFVATPKILKPTLQFQNRDDLFLAGQLTGVEGYMGNIATGLLAGVNMAHHLLQEEPLLLPPSTMLGALVRYVTQAHLEDFQPMKANFGILPPLPPAPKKMKKEDKYKAYAQRALEELKNLIQK